MSTGSALPDTLGAYIRNGREAASLSARQLANRANTTASNISRIESGETAAPTVELLKRIADVLDLDFAQVLAYKGITFTQLGPPSLATYLRQEKGLPDEAIAEVEAAIEQIAAKYQHRHQSEYPE